jgi:hypothetical protein
MGMEFMDLEAVRSLALALPEVTEAPHFNFGSFRVRGKIFITVPPEATHLHVFVSETDREQALALHPDIVEKLLWGGKVVGLRLALAKAPAYVVTELVTQAWRNKAPPKLRAQAGQ